MPGPPPPVVSSPEDPTAALRGECGHLRGCPRWDTGNLATPWDLPIFRDLQSADLKAVMRACWGQLEGRYAWDITRSDVPCLRELLRRCGEARRKAQAHAGPSSLCACVCPCIRALSCANTLLWFYFIYFIWLKNKKERCNSEPDRGLCLKSLALRVSATRVCSFKTAPGWGRACQNLQPEQCPGRGARGSVLFARSSRALLARCV